MHTLYFTRHGETVWNVENKICGMTDSPLTERGRQQARKLGEAVKASGVHIDEILYSPLSRAADTAMAIAEATGLPLEKLRNMGANSEVAPDSGTTSGSRQTLITGEAVRMAAAELRADLDGAGGDLSALEGLEYSAEFFDPTDKLGADKPNPKSHVAYGFATHVVILDGEGRVKEVYAAHDSGKVVNPTSIQGQIEGGVLMGLGYALTEDFPLKDCVPQAKFGTLGLMRADQIPDIHAIYVEKEELLPFAYGAKGIGEIATIPTAPAAQGAYYARDHILRTCLPMQDTFYKKPAKKAAP